MPWHREDRTAGPDLEAGVRARVVPLRLRRVGDHRADAVVVCRLEEVRVRETGDVRLHQRLRIEGGAQPEASRGVPVRRGGTAVPAEPGIAGRLEVPLDLL